MQIGLLPDALPIFIKALLRNLCFLDYLSFSIGFKVNPLVYKDF
ncbi:hypothetical protein KIS4809_1425 [Bacillus sp. ZZV12-4809]|nr:hypothetical protein KIS4809_1425 [Bacillus sp. ZZV12-4809]